MKTQQLMEEAWKYCIILDACRFDMFSKMYDLFITGDVVPCQSPATCTIQWLNKTFTEYYPDLCYISPVPFCNSKKTIYHKGIMFNGGDHFYKVFDAWNDCWSNKYETVLPQVLRRYSIKQVVKHPDKRFVIHFMQPHAPFLNLEPLGEMPSEGDLADADFVHDGGRYKGRMFIAKIIMETIGMEGMFRLKKRFRLKPTNSIERHYQKEHGDFKLLRKSYMLNLLTVLTEVKLLLANLPKGETVVTADHGELLGERRYWGHGIPKPPLYELITVPWCRVIK